MRGLVKAAALLLAPVLASASSSDPEDAIASVFVTLDIPLGVHKSTALTLRLDVEESDNICGPANVKINNQALSQSAKGGYTHGLLTLDDGSVIDASWVFRCIEEDSVPVEQLMSFTIKTFDHEPVLGVTFTANFKQTAPVFISEIEGATDVYQLAVPGTDFEDDNEGDEGTDGAPSGHARHDKEPSGSDGELDAQLAELEALRIQAYQLEEMIQFKEMAILEKMGIPMPPPPPPPPSPLRECDSIRCIVKTLKHKVKHACGGMMGGFLKHWTHGHPGHGHHGNQSWPFPPRRPSHHGPPLFCPPCHKQQHCTPYNPPVDEPPRNPHFFDGPPPPLLDQPPSHLAPPPTNPPNGNSRHDEDAHGEAFDVPAPPMGGHEHPLQPPPHHKDNHPPHDKNKRPPPPPLHQDLIIIAGMAAIAFAAFSLIGIGYIHRRVVRLTPESRQALHRLRHHTREEIRARHHNRKAARKAAIKAFFRRIFRCSDDDEEKEAMLQGRRRRDSGDEETTMEQEIAQFREAASMVEGIVAAEEGRLHRNATERREMIQHAVPPPPPPRPPIVPYHSQSLYPGYVMEDVHLPTYNEETVDSSVVSDGCRYTPGTSDYTPSTTASNADNVLGDSKH